MLDSDLTSHEPHVIGHRIIEALNQPMVVDGVSLCVGGQHWRGVHPPMAGEIDVLMGAGPIRPCMPPSATAKGACATLVSLPERYPQDCPAARCLLEAKVSGVVHRLGLLQGRVGCAPVGVAETAGGCRGNSGTHAR